MINRLLTLTFASSLFATPALAQTAFSCPSTCADIVWGDANGDGAIDIADSVVLFGAVTGQYIPCRGGDVNGDGQIDIADAVYLNDYLNNGGPAPIQQWCCDQCTVLVEGDVNEDGQVDIADATSILDYVNGTSNANICLAAADTNSDGVIDAADAKVLLDYLFSGGAAPAPLECI